MTPQSSNTKTNPAEKIFVALDVETSEKALAIVDECGQMGVGFKIGLQLFTASGPEIVRRISRLGHRVFLDLKFHDIPNTVAKAAIEATKLGVWMLNVHALGGVTMMRTAHEAVLDYADKVNVEPPKLIAVTILTSTDDATLAELGFHGPVEASVLRLAQLANESGLDGVVASAAEACKIKESIGSEFLVVTPGIRPAFATNDDQKRVDTPANAQAAGADFLVIGRPVIAADDRADALKRIIDELATIQ